MAKWNGIAIADNAFFGGAAGGGMSNAISPRPAGILIEQFDRATASRIRRFRADENAKDLVEARKRECPKCGGLASIACRHCGQ